MSTNWKATVEKINAATYVLPDGWDSRATVAEQLECSEEKVDDHLRPGLKSGRFIKQPMKVWDKTLGRNVMVIAYHDTANDAPRLVGQSGDVPIERLKELKAAGKSYAQIAAEVGLTRDATRKRLYKAG